MDYYSEFESFELSTIKKCSYRPKTLISHGKPILHGYHNDIGPYWDINGHLTVIQRREKRSVKAVVNIFNSCEFIIYSYSVGELVWIEPPNETFENHWLTLDKASDRRLTIEP